MQKGDICSADLRTGEPQLKRLGQDLGLTRTTSYNSRREITEKPIIVQVGLV